MPTTYQQKQSFRSVPDSVLEEFSFDGGLVTDIHETKLKPNQSPNLNNIDFNTTKSIKTRPGTLRYNTDPVGAASDQANTGASTGTVTLSTPSSYVAQSFQLSVSNSVVQIDAYLAMVNSGEQQYMKMELWSGSTGPVSLLSSGQILLVSGTAETKYSFRFRVPYAVVSSTETTLVLRPFVRGSTQSISSVLVHRTGNAYASGAAYSSTNAGLTWAAISSVDLKFNVFTGGNVGGTGLIRFYTSTGISQLFSKFGTTLSRGTDNTGAMTSITLGSGVSLTAGAYIDWTISNDTLLLVDGTNRIQKYRGSTNANYTTGTISVTNGSATVTGSSTVWNTTTNAAVGEYIKLPDGKWYMISAIASNTSLTIETTYQGSTLAAQTYTISPWGEVQGGLNTATVPTSLTRPIPEFIKAHANRIFTLTNNTLNYSALDTSVTGENFNDWDTVNNAGSITIPSNSGDSGTGLRALGNALYIFQRHAIWGLYGTSPANFELRNITKEVGLVHNNSLAEWKGLLIFLSDAGLIAFDGSNTKNISDGVVNTILAAIPDKTTATAVVANNKFLLAYAESGQAYNNKILEHDLIRQIYSRHDGVYASCFSVWGRRYR
jgi:hypothetical protein